MDYENYNILEDENWIYDMKEEKKNRSNSKEWFKLY
jgi:hypothetical protein